MNEQHSGSVLVLCTGNICRSPYIERVLAHGLADTNIRVESAGTGALVDHPIHASSGSRLTGLGIESSDFVARQLNPELIRSADLIIGATREHIGAAAQLSPAALRKGFALLDLADLLDGVSPEVIARAPGQSWVAKVAAEALMRRTEVNPRSPEDAAIEDPYERNESVFDSMAKQVAQATPIVIQALRG